MPKHVFRKRCCIYSSYIFFATIKIFWKQYLFCIPRRTLYFLFHNSDSYNSLLESIKASRRESERLRQLLGQKMNDMRILKRQILTDRSYPQRTLGACDLTPPPKHYGYGQGVSRCLDMVPTKDQHFITS